jgi:hypothetical protein
MIDCTPDLAMVHEGVVRRKMSSARPDEVVRDVVGDREAFGMAVARVRAYGRHFDRTAINRQLRAF